MYCCPHGTVIGGIGGLAGCQDCADGKPAPIPEPLPPPTAIDRAFDHFRKGERLITAATLEAVEPKDLEDYLRDSVRTDDDD